MWKRAILVPLMVVALLMFGTVACVEENDGPLEEAGESLDEAVDEVKDAGEDIGDEIEDGGDAVGDAIEDATDGNTQ